jgi:membrane protease YdiL (CAAX protease family)
MIACILIYPTALFTSQILDTINMLLFHITEPSKQSIVDYLQKTMQSPLAFFLTIVTIVVIAPISEEILFRGYLQTWLKKLFGKKIGILFASFIFALFHFSYPQGYGNITIIGSLFVVAIYFGILYERQKSLISPIIAHMIFNTISTINILLSKDL